MRVVMLANAASPHTRRWAEAMAQRGLEVTVVGIRTAVISGVEVRRVGFGNPQRQSLVRSLLSYLRLLVAARGILRSLRPDVVHAHYSVTHGVIAVAARIHPVVLTVWGSDTARGDRPSRGPKRWLNRLVFRRVDLVTAASAFLAGVVGTLGGSGVPVRVIPFGIDTGAFRPGVAEPGLIGFVKRFEPRYDPLTLLEAFAAMTHPGRRLLLVGGGSLRSRLEREIGRLGLEDRVELRGAVAHSEVPALLRRLAVLANPSRSESFGVINLEAAASGVPVVATRVGGTGETVIDGETGILVPVGDVTAMAAALDRVVGDPALREGMGAAGRRFAASRYDWTSSVDEMVAAYRGVVR